MISHFDSTLKQLSIHKVGNKFLDEPLTLSEQPANVGDEVLDGLLKQYFITAFEKVNEAYRLFHATGDNNLNEVFHFASLIFDDPATFHTNSCQLAKHLFDIADHPKI